MLSSSDYGFTCEFKGTHTIYETEVTCVVNKNEFNMSDNPTLYYATSSAVSGGQARSEIVDNSSWTPYITAIGLYNESGQLLVAGKLAKPLPKPSDMDIGLVMRFDS